MTTLVLRHVGSDSVMTVILRFLVIMIRVTFLLLVFLLLHTYIKLLKMMTKHITVYNKIHATMI